MIGEYIIRGVLTNSSTRQSDVFHPGLGALVAHAGPDLFRGSILIKAQAVSWTYQEKTSLN